MNIKVKEPTVGECSITSYEDMDKNIQYLIKALCGLQLICMNAKEDPEKHKEFINILKDATVKSIALFSENGDIINATEFFD